MQHRCVVLCDVCDLMINPFDGGYTAPPLARFPDSTPSPGWDERGAQSRGDYHLGRLPVRLSAEVSCRVVSCHQSVSQSVSQSVVHLQAEGGRLGRALDHVLPGDVLLWPALTA